MRIFDVLKTEAIDRSKNLSDENFFLRGLWRMNLLFKPNIQERLFEYTVIIAQTVGQGCCYTEEKPVLDKNLIGQDARRIHSSYSSIEIATLDAVYSLFPKRPVKRFILDGDSSKKSEKRAKIIIDEVAVHLGSTFSLKGKNIVNIGVVGNIVRELKSRGAEVYATDRDSNLIGSIVSDVKVESYERNKERIESCDLALITGMTLSTETLEDLINQCKASGTKIVVFAETGANFAKEYCRFGVNSVISEPFPFYIFSGISKIEIYRPPRIPNSN